MNKREIYDGMEKIEAAIQAMLSEVTLMKKDMQEIIEQNARLEIENQRLREHLLDIEKNKLANEQSKSSGTSKEMKSKSSARQNLEDLYNDGFHICNPYYGQRRENDEPCMFCLDVIDR